MNPIEEYNEAIQTGTIAAGAKIKAVYQHVVDNMNDPSCPYEYDAGRASMAIDFIEKFLYIPKLSPRQKMQLQLWQRAFVATIFGMVHKKNRLRQYRQAFLFVGRKNSKSCFAAAIALYLLLMDGESAPEIYSAATNRQQARILWEYAAIMLQESPALKKYLRKKVNLIECAANMGKFVPLSKDSGSLDGLNCSTILIDELHAIADRNMYDVLVGGTYARRQPLTLITSTGGYITPDSIFDTKYAEYQAIIQGYRDGSYIDETTFPVMYELDNKEEISDEALWVKANPNLGISKSVETLRSEVHRAQLDEKTMTDLLAKQFNVRQSSRDAFFEYEDVQNNERIDRQKLAGCYYVGGIDLSATTDLTCATALVVRPGDDKLYTLQMYWLPEDTMEEHERDDKAPYSLWKQQGWLRTCPGKIIDTRVVLEWFKEIEEHFGIYAYKFGYDRYNAAYLIRDMEQTYGEAMLEPIAQSFRGLSSQMYQSKAYFKDRRIVYDENPVFLWNLLNLQGQYDNEGNVKPYKNRNAHVRIDGYAAFLDAFCCFLDNQANLTQY